MSDQKKDLTNLMDYAKNLEKEGHGIPVPKGSVMEEQAIDKVDDFESLEDYGKHHPVPEVPVAPDPPMSLDPPSALDSPAANDLPEFNLSTDFSSTDSPPPAAPSDSASEALPNFDFSETAPDTPFASDASNASNAADASHAPQNFTEAPALELNSDFPPQADFEPQAEVNFAPDLAPEAAPEPAPKKPMPPDEVIAEKLRPAPPRPHTPSTALGKVRDYSERAISNRAPAQANFPFSLMITGRLAPEEQSRLIDIVTRENLGLREIDLEPMLASGRVLIPRISEYAGVVIVAALRTTRAKIRLGLADEIFATEDTREEDPAPPPLSQRASRTDGLFPHAAEEMPVTTESALAELPGLVVIDVISASAVLETREVEAERSSEYQEILEALQRELKYKAFRRGARALINFTIQLTPLRTPTQYRLTVLGSAVR